MDLSSHAAWIYNKILELTMNKALKIYEKALDGERLTQHQMDAAKDMLNKLPPMAPQQTASVTVNFGNLPRPGEVQGTTVETPILKAPDLKSLEGTVEKEKEGVVVPASSLDLPPQDD